MGCILLLNGKMWQLLLAPCFLAFFADFEAFLMILAKNRKIYELIFALRFV